MENNNEELLKSISLMMDQKLNQMDQKIDQKLDQMDQKIDQKLDQMDQKIDQKLDQMDQKIDQKLEPIKKDITKIKVSLELQEKSIQLLAEGYLPLAEKVETLIETSEETRTAVEIIEKVVTKHSFNIGRLDEKVNRLG